MSYSQRDVVMVPVPFTDLSTSKRRPVLVLSSTIHNARSPDILVAAITSNIGSPFSGVTINSSDMEDGALPRTSMVRPDKLYTLSQSLVVKYFGRINEPRFEDVLAGIDTILDRRSEIR